MYSSKRLASAKAEFKQQMRYVPRGTDDVLKKKCSLCESGIVEIIQLRSFLILGLQNFGEALLMHAKMWMWPPSEISPSLFLPHFASDEPACVLNAERALCLGVGFWYPFSNPNGSKIWIYAKKIKLYFDSRWDWNSGDFKIIMGFSFYSCVFWGLGLAFQLCSLG